MAHQYNVLEVLALIAGVWVVGPVVVLIWATAPVVLINFLKRLTKSKR